MKIAKTITVPKKEQIPLPLIPEEDEGEIDKTLIASFKLFSNPADTASPKYSFTMRKLSGTESLRRAIKWKKDIHTVMAGLAISTAPGSDAIINQVCSGAALTSYTTTVERLRLARHDAARNAAYTAVTKNTGETDVDFIRRRVTARDAVVTPVEEADVREGIRSIIIDMAPFKVLEKQKRAMRRFMRKPHDMKTRVYVNLMSNINNEELPNLPPNFSVAQKLSIDELIDLVTYGIPKSWLKKMDEHDFDPLAGALNDLVNFCERMEASEDHGKESTVVQKSSSKSTSNGRIPKRSQRLLGVVTASGATTTSPIPTTPLIAPPCRSSRLVSSRSAEVRPNLRTRFGSARRMTPNLFPRKRSTPWPRRPATRLTARRKRN